MKKHIRAGGLYEFVRDVPLHPAVHDLHTVQHEWRGNLANRIRAMVPKCDECQWQTASPEELAALPTVDSGCFLRLNSAVALELVSGLRVLPIGEDHRRTVHSQWLRCLEEPSMVMYPEPPHLPDSGTRLPYR